MSEEWSEPCEVLGLTAAALLGAMTQPSGPGIMEVSYLDDAGRACRLVTDGFREESPIAWVGVEVTTRRKVRLAQRGSAVEVQIAAQSRPRSAEPAATGEELTADEAAAGLLASWGFPIWLVPKETYVFVDLPIFFGASGFILAVVSPGLWPLMLGAGLGLLVCSSIHYSALKQRRSSATGLRYLWAAAGMGVGLLYMLLALLASSK